MNDRAAFCSFQTRFNSSGNHTVDSLFPYRTETRQAAVTEGLIYGKENDEVQHEGTCNHAEDFLIHFELAASIGLVALPERFEQLGKQRCHPAVFYPFGKC